MHGRVDVDFVTNYLDRALQEHDDISLVGNIESLVSEALTHRVLGPYLEILRLFLDSNDARVLDAVVLALSRLRVYFPDEVDDFMEETTASPELKYRVKRSSIQENPGDLIAHHGLDFIVNAVLRDPESPVMPLFIWWFEEATRARSFTNWIGLLIKVAINLIYGDFIFDTGRPQPDMRSVEVLT